jgi:hypothetical protein
MVVLKYFTQIKYCRSTGMRALKYLYDIGLINFVILNSRLTTVNQNSGFEFSLNIQSFISNLHVPIALEYFVNEIKQTHDLKHLKTHIL